MLQLAQTRQLHTSTQMDLSFINDQADLQMKYLVHSDVPEYVYKITRWIFICQLSVLLLHLLHNVHV